MSVFKIISVAAIVAVGASGAAFAQNKFEEVTSVEGWNIWKDHDAKNCFMERKDDAGNVVQMGLTTDNKLGYVGVFTQNDTDIKNGEIQELEIIIGENYYKGESKSMRGNLSHGYAGGYFLSDSERLAEDIAKQYVMTVFPGKDYVLEINLDGTLKGMEAARECIASF